ncbi:MAG TPA: Fic family protein [Acidimicrobiales bacterium]|nr:Fic family protein [Acidimicrobiales bacterium]
MSAFFVATQSETFFSTAATSDAVAYAVSTGRARRLGPRLYTRTVVDAEEDICRRNWAAIAEGYFPHSIISGRTAFLFKPSEDGLIFLTASQSRDVRVPGLRIRAQQGPSLQERDMPFMGLPLFMSSRPRAFLDNLKPSRSCSGAVTRTLSRAELEEALEDFGRYDVENLNRLRDQARGLASSLDGERRFATLDGLFGALLHTKDVSLTSRPAKARAADVPYDPRRIESFEQLASSLLASGLPGIRENPHSDVSVLAFYESYFSNYIEGAEFTVQEAREIVFEGFVTPERPKDAHDILGTYQLVSDPHERAGVPATADQLVVILGSQHGAMRRERPEVRPGRWKNRNNRVGEYEFVDHTLVEGTLREGFRIYASLPPGLARAAFAMYLVSEIHPFADGNACMARIVMNSELSVAGEHRIIVTTHDRRVYLAVLRGLGLNTNIDSYIRVLTMLQRRTAEIDSSVLEVAQDALTKASAYVDPDRDANPFGVHFDIATAKLPRR